MNTKRMDRSGAALCLGLAVCAAALYWSVMRYDFIHFDDNSYVFENRAVQSGLTAGSIAKAFTETYNGHWHPLTMLSYMLDTTLFGRGPAGYHFTNMLLHVLCTMLLFITLRELTGSVWRSAAVALLFAVHPLHVEPVAWIASRKDVLSTAFFLWTILAYAAYVRRGGPWRYAAVVVLLVAGLMAKAILVILPAVLLLLDYWPLRRHAPEDDETAQSFRKVASRLLIEKLPLFAVVLVFSALTITTARGSLIELDLHTRALNALNAYAVYVQKTVCPIGLAPFYPYPAEGLSPARIALALGLIGGITAAAVALYRRAPYFIVGWLWFLGAVLPVSGIMQAGIQAYADRYMYLSLIGPFIAIVWGCSAMTEDRPRMRRALWAVSAVVLVALAALTYRQIGFWRNDITLFEQALRVTRSNSTAHKILGDAYRDAGQFDTAFEHYQQGIKADPRDHRTYTAMGILLDNAGNDEQASLYYQAALEIHPDYLIARANLGSVLLRQGKIEEAEEAFQEALKVDPIYSVAINGLSLIYLHRGRLDEAEAALTKAITAAPEDPVLNETIAILYSKQSRIDEALKHFRIALEGAPWNGKTHGNLGVLLMQLKRWDEAITHLEEALRLDPGDVAARENLERCLAELHSGK